MDDILSGGSLSMADIKTELVFFGGISLLEDDFQGCCYKYEGYLIEGMRSCE